MNKTILFLIRKVEQKAFRSTNLLALEFKLGWTNYDPLH